MKPFPRDLHILEPVKIEISLPVNPTKSMSMNKTTFFFPENFQQNIVHVLHKRK